MITKKHLTILFICIISYNTSSAQFKKDDFNFHYQTTFVPQQNFKTKKIPSYYSTNTFGLSNDQATTITATGFLGWRLEKNTDIYFNPEVAGGKGLNKALGLAGFTNGESFRVGNPEPAFYVARAYINHYFSLTKERENLDDDVNIVKGSRPLKYIRIVLGKFSMADYFDCNTYSHDARSQFLNWALMSNGAWDYPANTRGYTVGAVVEYNNIPKKLSYRLAWCLPTNTANGPVLDYHIKNAMCYTGEVERKFSLFKKNTTIRVLAFLNRSLAGIYNNAVPVLTLPPLGPTIKLANDAYHIKYGYAINMEMDLNNWSGMFMRAAYNNGKTETWAFTEIDASISLGYVAKGEKWNRKKDHFGIAILANGLSPEHINFLKRGGFGFMLGDGNINYAPEIISELYYNISLFDGLLHLSPDYQIIINPGYNKDNHGPIQVVGARLHVSF